MTNWETIIMNAGDAGYWVDESEYDYRMFWTGAGGTETSVRFTDIVYDPATVYFRFSEDGSEAAQYTVFSKERGFPEEVANWIEEVGEHIDERPYLEPRI